SDVEAVVLAGELDPPAADRSGALERQVALVAEVELEEPAVLPPGAGDDRLRASEVLVEVRRVRVVGRGRLRADLAERLGERAVDVRVGARDARNRDRGRLDAPHVVAGV